MSALTNVKYIIVIGFSALFIYTNFQYIFNNYNKVGVDQPVTVSSNVKEDRHIIEQENQNLVHDDLKYILQWTSKKVAPFDFLGNRRNTFLTKHCEYNNCFVTDDRTFFINPGYFDAVVFNGKSITGLRYSDLPKKRSVNQKYIFAAMESPQYYPVCNPIFDNYFNWTWTYKLNSDFRWGYITIYDLNGTVIGPKEKMEWPEVLQPIGEELRNKFKNKKKAAAWFVSNCKTKSKREHFVEQIKSKLLLFNLTVDVFGKCGSATCKRFDKSCYDTLSSDYYFYFSFENSFAEDYVTEKLLIALENYAVPVVYGGADYTRFMPPGSYLNAKELGPDTLAEEMYAIMKNQTRYEDFHRWRNHYKYKETSEFEDVCNLCNVLNDDKRVNEVSNIRKFRVWWNEDEKSCSER